jgi:DNA-binding response OmpR family regulator
MDQTMTRAYARVLIVDDDQAVREMFAQLLRREGHSVHTAADAAAALEEVACWHPDAILLDYRMPLINGMGFLYRLRAQTSDSTTPVAIITGAGDLQGALSTECAALGAAVYFKPIRRDDLRAIAQALLTPGALAH